MKKITVFDTTLRDGAQSEHITLSIQDKRDIIVLLDELGVDIIEVCYPRSEADLAIFHDSPKLKHAKLAAFGSTRKHSTKVSDDQGLRLLAASKAEVLVIFGKAWTLHATEVLKCSLEENLCMIEESVAFLKALPHAPQVIFDAEHFFDGYAYDSAYALEVLKAAEKGGVDCICLCDTNGGGFPEDIAKAVEAAKLTVHTTLGFHGHNDVDMAVASTIFAVEHGVTHVQGTLCGFGERCGNANLASVIAGLQLKKAYDCIPIESMGKLTHIVRGVAEICNIRLPSSAPYIGRSAFAHKAGMHVDGVLKISKSFEHISPEAVGNSRRFLHSELSGRSQLLPFVQHYLQNARRDGDEVGTVLAQLRKMEALGYTYEAAEASLELLVRKTLGFSKSVFELIHYKVFSEQSGNNENNATSIVKIKVKDAEKLSAGEGDGPVHALDCALRAALGSFYPEISNMRLTDYKVRVLNPIDAAAARVRVLITSSDGENSWTTVGVSTDVIEASWQALYDSMHYRLELNKCGLTR